MIIIDTPIINVDDNADARKEAEKVISNSKRWGNHLSPSSRFRGAVGEQEQEDH